ncbi:hypothetical protein [Polluticaenibacter yanchengensis]|uniref:Lipoprotein n=1 Tax=Polluticaenibacter yanchengensis TaxID=3014562 RepID=A0ABT4UNB6_9BACT|nr:hypothetical protein [Chitinophagaceae bacterium LY-5]
MKKICVILILFLSSCLDIFFHKEYKLNKSCSIVYMPGDGYRLENDNMDIINSTLLDVYKLQSNTNSFLIKAAPKNRFSDTIYRKLIIINEFDFKIDTLNYNQFLIEHESAVLIEIQRYVL